MKPEDAIRKAMRDICDALIAKFESCADDEEFLDAGSRAFNSVRGAIRSSFLQAARFTEQYRDESRVLVMTRDTPEGKSPAGERGGKANA